MHSEDAQNGLDVAGAMRRGMLCLEQRRYPEAADFFKLALAQDPNSADAYMHLALCWMREPGKEKDAVDAARRAVALEPEHGGLHAILALTLTNMARDGEKAVFQQALTAAQTAISLAPDLPLAHGVEAQVLLRLQKFPEAEAAARRALELDPEDTDATEMLSSALLLQGKTAENSGLVDYHLQRHADDDGAHSAAGWQALMQGRHQEANQHFAEALRLNPMSQNARMGLVESYRARSRIFRAQLHFTRFMSRFTEGKQTMILLGGFILYRTLYATLKTSSPGLASILALCWLTLVLWSFLARGLSGFFLLFDRWARLSLTRREFWEGLVVGGMVFVALFGIVWTLLQRDADGIYVSLSVLIAATTSASAFRNDHYWGRYLYGAAAVLSGVGTLYGFLAFVTGWPLPGAGLALGFGSLIAVVFTWVASFRIGMA
ncbi:MAG: tetratricopeptide repeat protein [Verrucomicrobiales bacterium]|nr:tetratricopeptide repeat protein [Verrucomicrobiales bacterium]